MLTLEHLKNPSDDQLSRLDLAEVDLTLATGLPGSERLDVPACLAWIDRAAAWTRRQTDQTLHQFARDPGAYDGSEAIFRVVAMSGVLCKGMGVRYNKERADDPAPFTDTRDNFLHGIIEGLGGTCASLPVLYAAVGRRLGYPMKLVPTAEHLFLRWDDPAGERVNVEVSCLSGLDSYPDDHYRTWPINFKGTPDEEIFPLRSLTPREEVAKSWGKRGLCFHDNGRLREAVQCFATACSIVTDNRLRDRNLFHLLGEWRKSLAPKIPAETPRLTIEFAPSRRYPGIPVEFEREIIATEIREKLLTEPIPPKAHVVVRVLS